MEKQEQKQKEKDTLFSDVPEEGVSLEQDDVDNGPEEKRFGWKNILFIAVVLLIASLTVVFLFWNLLHKEAPNGESSLPTRSETASQAMVLASIPTQNETQDASETESIPDASEESSSIPDQPTHGWVINNMGYTYLYNGIGVEQFNASEAMTEKYIRCIQELAKKVPSGTSVYCMPVPTRIGFLYGEISKDIRREDDFFNSSQRAFLDTVGEQLKSNMTFVHLYQPFEEAYLAKQELFFRTDKNWTADAAYLAYQTFCKASGNAPVTLAAYEEKRIEPFLGSFYQATASDALRNHPDTFLYYRSDETDNCVVTLYSGSSVYKNYSLAGNGISDSSDAYSVYLGTTGAYFKIESPCTSGKKLLLVGDQSAAAILPYLVANYSEVHYIDAALYADSFASLFEKNKFQDVLFMSYLTNAVKGTYPEHLAVMAGVS